MSYSFTVAAPRGELRTKLDEAVAVVERSDTDADEERREHLVAALGCVHDLVDAVGRSDDDVFVSVSGHANPDHAPRGGWADEVITINVTAKPPAPQPTKET